MSFYGRHFADPRRERAFLSAAGRSALQELRLLPPPRAERQTAHEGESGNGRVAAKYP